MGRDSLRTAIETALDGAIDDGLWEKCAVSLLRAEVPSLVLLTGGDDGGLDAVSIEGEWGLVATTGNALSNLKKNLRRHLDVGGRTRRILVATPRRVTNAQRRNLVKAASGLGFDLTLGQVFDQEAFTERLYRDSAWRKQLLGLSGTPPALSSYPKSMRPTVDIPLIGRESELEQLTSAQGDVLLVGEPGSGKTFLSQALVAKGDALFAVDFDSGVLADAIRDMQPKRIIVEDVHLVGIESYMALAHLRTELDVDFTVVTTTWPHHMEEWRSHTQAPDTIQLERLTRDQLVQIIQHVGVAGPNNLVRLIVDQSMGRPGLAVLLAGACRSGQIMDVARGDVLMQEVANTYRRLLGAQSISLLGFLALSGKSGVRLEQVASALELDLATTHELLVGLAHGGTVEEQTDRRLVVIPPNLRAPLVAEAFLSASVPLPLQPFASKLDDPSACLEPLIEARRRNLSVDEHLLEKLLQASSNLRDFADYASLGERQAKIALELAPSARRQIALASFGAATKFATKLLLEDAVGDDRPRHSHPDHAMRELRDFIGWRPGGTQIRLAVFDGIEEWLSENGDHDVALEAMCLVLRPGWEGHETDPGLGMTVTISAGLISIEELKGLVQILDRAVQRICVLRPKAYGPLIEVLNQWAHPSMLSFGQVPTDRIWSTISRRALRRAIEQLSKCLPERLGLNAQLRELSIRTKLRADLHGGHEFEVLFPRERDSDWKRTERLQQAAVTALARSFEVLSPKELATRLALYEAEAAKVGITWPRWTPYLCSKIASAKNSTLEYVRSFQSDSLAADLVDAFLEPAIDRMEHQTESVIADMFNETQYEYLAINVALRREDLSENLMNRAIASCSARHSQMLDILAIRNQLREEALSGLLGHSDQAVARAVAVGIRDHVPPALRTAWEDAIVGSPADDYWYSVIFKREPALLGRWIVAYCQRQEAQPSTYEHIPHTIPEVLATLSQSDRIQLLRGMPSSAKSHWLDDIVRGLVGDDPEVFDQLLSRDDLETLHTEGLAGHPSSAWFKKADVALRRGWPPEKIVSAVYFSDRGWSGEQSAYWQGWIREFEAHRKGASRDHRRIIDVAVDRFGRLRADALAEGRKEAITGLR